MPFSKGITMRASTVSVAFSVALVSSLAGGARGAGAPAAPAASVSAPAAAVAGQPATLAVEGDLPTSRLSLADLEALGPAKVEWSIHGRKREALGVPLDKVLSKAGFVSGPMGKEVAKREKRAGWKKALVATAADGYQAVFSCAELFPEMGPTRAFVVWQVDGKPLPPEEAPLRLVVTTDQEPSRSLYQLVKLEVVDLRAK
jgi:Oxidoreductase molybdopterin binding domain